MLLSLPPEIIIQILRELHPHDCLSCQLACKHLHGLISNSSELQYYAALLPALADDNPCSTLPVAEKLAALRRAEHAWFILRPAFTMSVPVTHIQSGVYDLTAGVYFLSNATRNALHYLRLPSKETDEIKWDNLEVEKTIIDIGLCLYEHDLIVIVTSTPVQHHAALRPVYQIELQLMEFSTGQPHPDAQESRILVMNSQWEKPAVGLEIVGANLVLILSFNTAQRPEDRVFIYEWQTNTLKTSWVAPYRSYSGLLFLTEHLILIPNTRTESLDIFRIPSRPTFDTPSPVLVLKLPGLAEGRVLGGISTRSEPNPIGAHSHLGRRGSGPQRAFLSKPADAICIFDLRVLVLQMVLLPGGGLNMNFQFRHRFTFITHRSAFVALVERFGRKDREGDIEKHEVEVGGGDGHGDDRMEEEEVAQSLEDFEEAQGQNQSGNSSRSTSPPSLRNISPSEADSDEDQDQDQANATSSSASTSPGPPTLSYSLWGPPISRWFNSDEVSTHWITTTSGQRCVQMEDSTPGQEVPIIVLDFNPAHVKEGKRRQDMRERRRLEEALKRAAEREFGFVEATRSLDEVDMGRVAAEAGTGGRGVHPHFVPEAEGGGEHWEEEPVVHPRIPRPFTPDGEGDKGDEGELDEMKFHRDQEDVEDDFDYLHHRRQYHFDRDDGRHSPMNDDPAAASPDAGPSTRRMQMRMSPPTESVEAEGVFADGGVEEEEEEGGEEWNMDTDEDADWGDGNEDSNSDEDDIQESTLTAAHLHPPGPSSPQTQTQEDDNRTWTVTSTDQLQPAETFAEPVLGGLPYVACATAEGYAFDGVLLDEERVLGLKTNLTDHIERVEVLYFG